jgi:hypothetical protein
MPLFRAASATIEPPPEAGPVIHNHQAPSYTGLFLAAVFTAIGVVVLGWWALVYLFGAVGFRHPEQPAATLLIVLGVSSLAGWGLSNWLGGLYLTAQANTHEHQQEMSRLHLEAVKCQAMAQTRALPTGRASEQEQAWSRLILAVMFEAYNLAPFKAKAARPWSRERVIEIAANAVPPIKIKHTQAAAVDPWLRSNGIITDDRQINRAKFDSLADVEALLFKLYDRPITVNRGLREDALPGKYEFID